MKFVIDRKTWRRGGQPNNHEGPTHLLNTKGNMCCLGHIARQCNIPEADILNKPDPECVPPRYTTYHEIVTINGMNNHLTWAAMSINDRPHITDSDREQMLTRLFVEHGHELEFVG